MPTSAYIHVPFCRQKCFYCSFVSYPQPELIEPYITALKNEIKHFYKNEYLKTIYLGGGTPSILTPSQINQILSEFSFDSQTEVTMEVNPENISAKDLAEIKKIGINRLSIGCQSFDENILKTIGRKHSPQDVETAVKTAQDCGIQNISLDFIYGLPQQTIESFSGDLEKAKNLGVPHISLYGLKIEEGCKFYQNPPEKIADEDLQADMFLRAIQTLNDFEHYEISNFARKGFFSRHNLNYWNNENYYGFGAAAHGYENETRYANQTDLKKYIENPFIKASEQHLSTQEKLEEEIFLGFRKMSGINSTKINEKYSIDFEKKYAGILQKYSSGGYLEKTHCGWKLTANGILVSNVILSEFLEE